MVQAQGDIPSGPTDISPLLIGEQVPEISLLSLEGDDISLNKIFAQKPSVIVFYRGGWCPYCNVHLSELQKIEKDILGLGYQILAISPDAIDNLQATVDKNSLNYTLLSDANMNASDAFGITFKAPDRYSSMLSEKSGGKNQGYLPVPSVFIVDEQGKITFEYINPDYKSRLSGDMLLAVLNSLSPKK